MSDAQDIPEDRETVRAIARAQLAALLPRVMKDAVLDADERQELLQNLQSGLLERNDVREVFREFLAGLHAEVMADGVVTDEERERVIKVVKGLRIPHTFLPTEIVAIVGSG